MRITFSLKFGTKGESRTGAPPEKILWFVFINFDFITLVDFDLSQHAMFTICILFIALTTKTYGMFKGVSIPTTDLRILPRRDHAVPLSATGS